MCLYRKYNYTMLIKFKIVEIQIKNDFSIFDVVDNKKQLFKLQLIRLPENIGVKNVQNYYNERYDGIRICEKHFCKNCQ